MNKLASQLGHFVPLEILFFNMAVDPLAETLKTAILQNRSLPGRPLQDPMCCVHPSDNALSRLLFFAIQKCILIQVSLVTVDNTC